jgi:hypothetical protein
MGNYDSGIYSKLVRGRRMVECQKECVRHGWRRVAGVTMSKRLLVGFDRESKLRPNLEIEKGWRAGPQLFNNVKNVCRTYVK